MERESKASNPLELKYMKSVRFSLNSLGLWPNKEFGDDVRASRALFILNNFLILAIICSICSSAMYAKKNLNDLGFVDLGHTYINILLSCTFCQRLTMSRNKNYREIIKEFVTEFHLMLHKHKSDFGSQMSDRVDKMCTAATVIINVEMYMGLSLYNVVPFYKNFDAGMFSANRPVNGTFRHSIDHLLPIDQYRDASHYTLMFILNWYISYVVSTGICCFDLMASLIVFHIWGHLNILSHNMEIFDIPSQKSASGNESTIDNDKRVFDQLKDLITYHKIIKKFLMKTSKAYGLPLCMFYALHQVVGCVLLLKCSSMDPEDLGTYGLLTVTLFQQLIQLSVIFEIIGSKTDQLVGDVYCLPWEDMTPANRKIVLQFLQNAQIPMSVKAANVVPVGVRTMSAVLRASCSYFIMLRTFQRN